jgi:hypothetical protein
MTTLKSSRNVRVKLNNQFDLFQISTMRTSKTFEESSLKEEVDRHWQEIVKHTFQFERNIYEVRQSHKANANCRAI